MRVGRWMAAAAFLLVAGQANAARYYEFTIVGDGYIGAGNDMFSSPTAHTVLDTLVFSFDTATDAVGGSYYSRDGIIIGQNGLTRLFNGVTRGDFSLDFALASVAYGGFPKSIDAGGDFTYYTCDRATCVPAAPTRLISLQGRTSDIAPAKLGIEIESIQSFPTPEPATWAMMILGMGVVGSAMRRRRASIRVSFA